MTAQEMADKIVECVRECTGRTFIELVAYCGKEAEGDCSLALNVEKWEGLEGRDNVILWSNISKTFQESFNLAKPFLHPHTMPQFGIFMCYGFDGQGLKLPLANPRMRKPPKKTCWLPVTFSLEGK